MLRSNAAKLETCSAYKNDKRMVNKVRHSQR